MILPKISVIIPNYNHGRYLKQRIESVVQQTYSNFEVIILDDCSTDNSQEIIAAYDTHPLITKIVLNSENSGSPFKQWKRGIELAGGDWVWVAESDDYSDLRFLELMVAALVDQKRCGLVYCDSRIVSGDTVSDETFATLKNAQYGTQRWSVHHTNNGQQEIEDYLLPGGTINNTSAVIFSKAILLAVDPFDLTLKYIGDKYTFIKVLAVSDVVYIPEALNYYRDPFNTKHANKLVFYFYEQFLVFDWVYRNLKITREKFFDAFYGSVQNSLFRGWDRSKMALYLSLFRTNRFLLMKSMTFNLARAFGFDFSDRLTERAK